jgi:cyclomaltodextrinase
VTAPAWVNTAIVYGIVPFLYGRDHPFQAVTARLSDLSELGANTLWLSPVTVPAPGDFGYAVIDYSRPNPDYGSEEDFRALVSEAHQRGIRVLIDFVPNHTSDLHPFFLDGKHDDWYDRDARGEPTHYFNWENLPNLNYDKSDVRRWMTAAFAHWVRAFDVDGFRVDACWGVRERRPDYWPAWRNDLLALKPDLLLLAEATGRDGWYYENGFDVGYDWTDELGKWAWEFAFDDPAAVAGWVTEAIAADPHPDRVLRFLNNNDTGPRFLTTHGPGMTRVATAMLLTLPGLPCLFTGDEVGAEYEPYASPSPVDFSADRHDLRDWHRRLCALRGAMPALHASDWTPLAARPATVFAYLRHGGESQPVLVVLNFDEEAVTASIEIPAGFEHPRGSARLTDVLNDRAVEVGRGIEIGPYEAMVLAAEGGA